MKKKFLSLAMAALMLSAVTLTSCGNQSNNSGSASGPVAQEPAAETPAVQDTETDTDEQSTEPVEATDETELDYSAQQQAIRAGLSGELTVWVRGWSYYGLTGGTPDQPYYDYMREQFPGLVINEVIDRGWEELTAAIASGDAPDAYFWEGEPPQILQRQLARGFCEPLDSYIDSDPVYKDAFLDGILDTHKVDGVTYGLPIDIMPISILVNKDIFDKLNVPYPSEDWTIDEFVETAKALTNKSDPTNKTVGIVRNIDEQDYTRLLNFFLQAYGVKGYKEVDGQKLSNLSEDPNAITAIEKYIEIQGNNYACTFSNDERVTLGLDTSIWDIDWEAGVGGMFAGASCWGMMVDDATKQPLFTQDVYSAPTGDGGRGTYVTIIGMSMFAGSNNKDLAWEYLKAMTSKEFREAAYAKNEAGETIHQFRFDENSYRFGFGIPAYKIDELKLTGQFKDWYMGFKASAGNPGITPVHPETLVQLTKDVDRGEKQLVDALKEYDDYVNANNLITY